MNYYCPFCGKEIFWNESQYCFICENCDCFIQEIDCMSISGDNLDKLDYL